MLRGEGVLGLVRTAGKRERKKDIYRGGLGVWVMDSGRSAGAENQVGKAWNPLRVQFIQLDNPWVG